MASIKQISERKYKITISNGYRTDGRKGCKAKTIQVPDSVPKRGVGSISTTKPSDWNGYSSKGTARTLK